MYSVVLMVAVTTGGDTASFGNKGNGCSGYTAGCSGSSCNGGGFLGLRSGGGLFKHKGSGCHGTTAATCGCCGSTATVPVAMPAPVPAPAPVVATGCTGSMYSGGCHGGNSCHGGGFLGLRSGGSGCSGGGFLGKHKGGGCSGCHGY